MLFLTAGLEARASDALLLATALGNASRDRHGDEGEY
jgi:hypothetical protein